MPDDVMHDATACKALTRLYKDEAEGYWWKIVPLGENKSCRTLYRGINVDLKSIVIFSLFGNSLTNTLVAFLLFIVIKKPFDI